MANNIVQLKDKDDNNIFPIAGGMAADSITTAMVQNGAVTAEKIDLAPQSVGTLSDIEVYYQVVSGLVFLTVHSITNTSHAVSAWGSMNIGTLPSDARPKSQGFFLSGVALDTGSDAIASGVVIAVAGNGAIQIQNKNASSVDFSRVHASGFYPIGSLVTQ